MVLFVRKGVQLHAHSPTLCNKLLRINVKWKIFLQWKINKIWNLHKLLGSNYCVRAECWPHFSATVFHWILTNSNLNQKSRFLCVLHKTILWDFTWKSIWKTQFTTSRKILEKFLLVSIHTAVTTHPSSHVGITRLYLLRPIKIKCETSKNEKLKFSIQNQFVTYAQKINYIPL